MNLQYKIWDKPNKHWVKPPYCINQYGDLQVKDTILFINDDFEICLCTNKLDKSVNLMYEGHIIAVVDFKKGLTRDDMNIIKWSDSGLQFVLTDIHGKYKGDMSEYYLEYYSIVGHILENPELLEVST